MGSTGQKVQSANRKCANNIERERARSARLVSQDTPHRDSDHSSEDQVGLEMHPRYMQRLLDYDCIIHYLYPRRESNTWPRAGDR